MKEEKKRFKILLSIAFDSELFSFSAGIFRFMHNIWSMNSIFVHHITENALVEIDDEMQWQRYDADHADTCSPGIQLDENYWIFVIFRKKLCYLSVLMHLFNFKDIEYFAR